MRGASLDNKTDANRGLSLEQLAHELNSKLDSSMRTLTLAEQTLSGHTAADRGGLDDVASKLRRVGTSLREMAGLLDRAMVGGSVVALLTDGRSISQCVDDILAGIAPLAEKHDVDLDTRVSPEAAGLQGAALASVVENGLRNAIEACAEVPGTLRRVRMMIEIADGALTLTIHDSGTGLRSGATKPGSHGLGLGIAGLIVAELSGTLDLSNHPAGGALLTARVPLSNLIALEAA